MKCYDRRISTNKVSIIITTITHIKRDSDCKENEKDISEKQVERKSQTFNLKNKTFWAIYRESRVRKGIKLSLKKNDINSKEKKSDTK